MALDYFTLAEFRELPDMQDTTAYPDARVTAAGEYIQAVIEGACGTSFVGRSVIETLDAVGGDQIVLSTPYVLGVASVVIDGLASSDQFTVKHGVLQRRTAGTYTPLSWGYGRRNVTVTYTAGYSSTPPADIKEAAMRATRAYLLETSENSGVLDRRSSVTNDLGGTTTYVVASENQPTGYPQVDAVINRWARKLNTVVYP